MASNVDLSGSAGHMAGVAGKTPEKKVTQLYKKSSKSRECNRDLALFIAGSVAVIALKVAAAFLSLIPFLIVSTVALIVITGIGIHSLIKCCSKN
jgi:hypothetical protein